jgi:hypothetical protein
MKSLTISERVSRKIDSKGPDSLWTFADFKGMPETAVAAALCRLLKKGTVSRVRKGVYYVPKDTRFGRTVPESPRVAEAILNARGIHFCKSGLEMYNKLGITTQVSPVVTLVVDRDLNSFETGVPGRIRIRSVHNPARLMDEERAALDALREINSIPDSSPEHVVRNLVKLVRSEALSFSRLVTASFAEPPRVRALLGMIGSIIGADESLLAKLRESLNKTTKFKLGLSRHFGEAKLWAIL